MPPPPTHQRNRKRSRSLRDSISSLSDILRSRKDAVDTDFEHPAPPTTEASLQWAASRGSQEEEGSNFKLYRVRMLSRELGTDTYKYGAVCVPGLFRIPKITVTGSDERPFEMRMEEGLMVERGWVVRSADGEVVRPKARRGTVGCGMVGGTTGDDMVGRETRPERARTLPARWGEEKELPHRPMSADPVAGLGTGAPTPKIPRRRPRKESATTSHSPMLGRRQRMKNDTDTKPLPPTPAEEEPPDSPEPILSKDALTAVEAEADAIENKKEDTTATPPSRPPPPPPFLPSSACPPPPTRAPPSPPITPQDPPSQAQKKKKHPTNRTVFRAFTPAKAESPTLGHSRKPPDTPPMEAEREYDILSSEEEDEGEPLLAGCGGDGGCRVLKMGREEMPITPPDTPLVGGGEGMTFLWVDDGEEEE